LDSNLIFNIKLENVKNKIAACTLLITYGDNKVVIFNTFID